MLVLVIVSFVLMSTPITNNDLSSRQKPLFLFGYDFNSPYDLQPLQEKTLLSNLLERKRGSLEEMMVERAAYLSLADTVGLPMPNAQQFKDYLRSQPLFMENDSFSPTAYKNFTDQLRTKEKINETVLAEAIKEDYRIDQIKKILSNPPLVLPIEAKRALYDSKKLWTVAIGELDYNSFPVPDQKVDKDTLLNFFQQQKERYRIAEKTTLSAVYFPSVNYASKITQDEPDEITLRNYYNRYPERFNTSEESLSAKVDIKEKNGPSNEAKDNTFEKVKDTVRIEWLKETTAQSAQLAAEYAAADFAAYLDKNNIKEGSPAFKKHIEETNALEKQLGDFSIGTFPANLFIPKNILEQQANFLDENRYFSNEPIELKDGAAILIFKGKEASTLPALETVIERVREDYLETERKKAFFEEGLRLKTVLNEALTNGMTFQQAAEMQGMKVTSIGPFSAENPHQGDYASLLIQYVNDIMPFSIAPLIASLKPGELSEIVEGRVVYIVNKETIEADQEAIKNTIKRLKDLTERTTQWSLLSEVLEREVNSNL